jgi:branched-chain amino acid transport system substrate-binding protein
VPVALAALVALALSAGAGASTSASAASTQGLSCKSTLRLALVTPLTGGGGFIGSAQAVWAKYAVKTLPQKYGLKVQLLLGDTPVEQGNAIAQTLAQKYVGDKRVVAIIGPATSGAVAATSKTYTDAGVAHISPSATRTSLTKTNNKEATSGFFRVVPDDGIQGPTDAKFMVNELKVKKVVLVDFQEPYSVGLADQVQEALKKAGVTTQRESASIKATDYSSLVTKVPSDADIVFFATQQPEDAQTFARQLAEQGKRAKVFGGDGSNGPGKFTASGSYLSNFAAPVDLFPYNKAIIDGVLKDNPDYELEAFGPPAYGAVQMALEAIKKACDANKGQLPDRRAVIKQVKKIQIKNWILGGTFKWSTKTNDPLNGVFYIFQIQSNGDYKLITKVEGT